jgi:ABC-type amino acid transport system permease subunit
MFESIAAFWAEYGNVLTDGVWDTLVMVVISTAFAYLIGLPLGVALILTQPHGIRPHRGVYRVLDWIVNIGRSVPFIILMVAIMPFTRMVVGTTIGGRYLTEDKLAKIRALNGIAADRGQSLAQMALCWVLRRREVTSVLIGASSTAQLEDNVMSLNRMEFTADELQAIENILK